MVEECTTYMNHVNSVIKVPVNAVDPNLNIHDFQYLGAWIDNIKPDIKIKEALAWKPIVKIWKSTLPRSIKISLVGSTIERELLYGCDAMTLTK